MKLSLKKSKSLIPKNDTQTSINPETLQKFTPSQSHVEQMIFQKYNFSHRLKTNIYQKPSNRHLHNATTFIPSSHIIAVTQLPKIDQNNPKSSHESLFENFNKISTKQKQNSIENSQYTFVRAPPRNPSDYSDCIKRIHMNTTYRGFNFTNASKRQKNRYQANQMNQNNQAQKVSVENQDVNKTPLKPAERKMIIQHLIEKGFAKKMEDSLIKVRNEKRKVHYDLLSKKSHRPTQVMKSKKSAIFHQVQSTPVYKIHTLRNLDLKQHLIEPW